MIVEVVEVVVTSIVGWWAKVSGREVRRLSLRSRYSRTGRRAGRRAGRQVRDRPGRYRPCGVTQTQILSLRVIESLTLKGKVTGRSSTGHSGKVFLDERPGGATQGPSQI